MYSTTQPLQSWFMHCPEPYIRDSCGNCCYGLDTLQVERTDTWNISSQTLLTEEVLIQSNCSVVGTSWTNGLSNLTLEKKELRP